MAALPNCGSPLSIPPTHTLGERGQRRSADHLVEGCPQCVYVYPRPLRRVPFKLLGRSVSRCRDNGPIVLSYVGKVYSRPKVYEYRVAIFANQYVLGLNVSVK